jgi:hypothetical protein
VQLKQHIFILQDMKEMITKTVPSNILLDRELNIPEPLGELHVVLIKSTIQVPYLPEHSNSYRFDI